jgi:hypothetical protein
MQPENNLVAAHFATWWAQKFALRLTELADQLVVDGIRECIWEIVVAIRQSFVIKGFWRARVTVVESPSRINEVAFVEIANLVTSSAARASPKTAVHGGLIREEQWVMIPEEFRITAAWTKKGVPSSSVIVDFEIWKSRFMHRDFDEHWLHFSKSSITKSVW